MKVILRHRRVRVSRECDEFVVNEVFKLGVVRELVNCPENRVIHIPFSPVTCPFATDDADATGRTLSDHLIQLRLLPELTWIFFIDMNEY